ncbi:MAG: type II secretion system F family protein [Blastocatellia bacterium]
MIPFFIFLFCLFATYSAYLIVTRKTAQQRAQVNQRLSDVLAFTADSPDPAVQIAREDLMSEIPLLNRLLGDLPTATRLKLLIEQANLDLTVTKLLMFSGVAGLLGFLAASAVMPLLAIELMAAGLAACAPFLHVLYRRRKRLNRFLADLPEALELMSRALAAGHAFSETLKMISEEMHDPIAMEFRRAYEEHNLGLSPKLALENLATRIPLLDLRICITAIQIQRETGGNLGEILERVATTIRERFRILEDLKTLTSQSRISAWVLCAMPAFIAIMMTVINPDYMSVLWNDPRGQKLIALAIAMQIMGMLMVRKIINIKI